MDITLNEYKKDIYQKIGSSWCTLVNVAQKTKYRQLRQYFYFITCIMAKLIADVQFYWSFVHNKLDVKINELQLLVMFEGSEKN